MTGQSVRATTGQLSAGQTDRTPRVFRHGCPVCPPMRESAKPVTLSSPGRPAAQAFPWLTQGERPCAYCGAPLPWPARADRLTCSTRCRVATWRAGKRHRAAPHHPHGT